MRMFFMGIEYSVILSSVLLYMKSLNVSKVFMGFVVAVYPLAADVIISDCGLYLRYCKANQRVTNRPQPTTGNTIHDLPFSI